MNRVRNPQLASEARLEPVIGWTGLAAGAGGKTAGKLFLVVVVALLVALAGCESDEDCINCVELPPPVVPTGVHSISGNNEVIVQWIDIAYAPYDDSYNENVTSYLIYSRFYRNGDEFNPDRTFDPIGEVAWDENYDGSSGLHWFYDVEAVNGEQYEYAVAAVNAAGRQSALSFEFVADAPLPMSPVNGLGWFTPVEIFDTNGGSANLSAFNFRTAGLNPTVLTAGRVSPASTHHIKISFEGGIAYAIARAASTRLQDFGSFNDGSGNVIFEGVSWAPADGYSRTGKIELIAGHVYVVEIVGPAVGELHYAKFGINALNTGSVDLIWAYQLIAGLPELKVPERDSDPEIKPQLIKL